MNYGPLVFLAAFFALASSWVGFVLAPQLQIGQLQQTNALVTATPYPIARPGLAQEGREVYRANGCATCHSQQVGQTGTVLDVMLSDAGTNPPALVAALLKLKPGLSEAAAKQLFGQLPRAVLQGGTKETVEAAAKTLRAAGAKTQLWVQPVGPDIARGWANRRTVAEDYLFDDPVMLGAQRIGPDLANVGVRLPDPNWHLLHLFAPQGVVKGSTMPPYRFLFERRKIERECSSDALALPRALAPAPGYEVVPKPEAKALVAYLTSLRADTSLFPAPFTVAVAAPTSATTNAPGGISINAPATKAPAQ